MNKTIFTALAAAMLAAGCSRGEIFDQPVQPEEGTFTISASMPGSPDEAGRSAQADEDFVAMPWNDDEGSSRLSLDGTGLSTLWSANDKIKLLQFNPQTGNLTSTGTEFILSSGADTRRGKFTGTTPAGQTSCIAVYPSTAAASGGGLTNTVEFTAPDVYEQSANGNSAHIAAGNLMYSDPVTYQGGESLGFELHQAMAMLEFNVTMANGTTDDMPVLYYIRLTEGTSGTLIKTVNISTSGQIEYRQSAGVITLKTGATGHTFAGNGGQNAYKGWMPVAVEPMRLGYPIYISVATSKGTHVFTKYIPSGGSQPGLRPGVRYKVDLPLDAANFSGPRAWRGNVCPMVTADHTTKKIMITCPEDLAWVSGVCAKTITDDELYGMTVGSLPFNNYTLELTTDLYLNENGSTTYQWTPIGDYKNYNNAYIFWGTFDGKNHTIHNLYVNKSTDYAGLFGYAYAIKNLSLSGGSVTSSANSTGAFTGVIMGLLENCHNESCTVRGRFSVGGLAGNGYNDDTTIRACSNRTNVVADLGQAGGIVGYGNRAFILACLNTGNVTATTTWPAGGITSTVGDNGAVSGCVSSGTVSASQEAGLLVGWASASFTGATATINYNYYVGSGTNYVGGESGTVVKSNNSTVAAASSINVATLNTTLISGGTFNTQAGGWLWYAVSGTYPEARKQ